MIRVHFLINKLDIEHIIALGGKKSNEKLGKKGNRCKNAANSVTGHVCVNSNVVSRAFGVRTNLYLRIVPVNGTIIGGILNR